MRGSPEHRSYPTPIRISLHRRTSGARSYSRLLRDVLAQSRAEDAASLGLRQITSDADQRLRGSRARTLLELKGVPAGLHEVRAVLVSVAGPIANTMQLVKVEPSAGSRQVRMHAQITGAHARADRTRALVVSRDEIRTSVAPRTGSAGSFRVQPCDPPCSSASQTCRPPQL